MFFHPLTLDLEKVCCGIPEMLFICLCFVKIVNVNCVCECVHVKYSIFNSLLFLFFVSGLILSFSSPFGFSLKGYS